VRYSASIEPFEQVSLAFKASGYVDALLRRNGADGRARVAQAGDRITRGAVLGRVRDAEYRERVGQSRAKLAEGEASLVKARLDLDRARTLFASDSLTKPELDAAQAAFDGAQARVAAARGDLELALTALADCSLVAPAAGVILERRIEVGTLASIGTVGFVLGDLSSVKARFGIPDAMIASIRLGDALDVTVEGAGAATFSGRVTAIAPAADPQSRVFDVEVGIANRDGRLRPGMIGTVAIDQRASAAAAALPRPLAVPLTAVVRSAQGTNDFAVLLVERQKDADIARLRRVELGEVVGNAIAVLKGINPGDRVVVSGATLLSDGDAVKVIQ
jgi:multidrug efflux system membrane fusion protein